MRATPATEFDRRIEAWTDETIWREYYAPTGRPRVRRQARLQAALTPRPGERVLDVGCGAGGLAFWAARVGAHVVGVDFSHASLVAATRFGRRLGPSAPAYVLADATTLPVRDAQFEKVVCVDVLDVLPRERHERVLGECLRAIRPGGSLILYTPNARRETIGQIVRPLRRRLGAWRSRECSLHIGLTSPSRLRRLVRQLRANGRLAYADMNYPWLAALPLLRGWLAGHMLWTITRPESG